MPKKGDLDKKRLIIDAINNELNSYTPWVSRKEIASWTAIAFYIAIILSSTGFLYNNFSEYKSFSVPSILIILPFMVILFSITVALFIHSQFSAIYDKEIISKILRKNIYKVIDSDDINDFNLKFDNDKKMESRPHFISDEYYLYIDKNKRPGVIKNFRNLWKGILKRNFEMISTHQRQEALLYQMIIIFFCIFLGSVFYIGWCT